MLNLGYPVQEQQAGGRGPFWLMTAGYNMILFGFGLWIFLDWRYLVTALIVGGGNLLIGIIWFGHRVSQEEKLAKEKT